MDATFSVIYVPEKSRYELRSGERTIGFADAMQRGTRVVIPHVEVDREYMGRGLGSRLVREMLNHVRAMGCRVVPLCPFVAAFIRRYPDYADLRA